MDTNTLSTVDLDLRQFFTGLADAARLRIAGQLAAGDATAEALAAALGEKPAAVRHSLARLQKAGLVAGPAGAAQAASRARRSRWRRRNVGGGLFM
jgi:DNA-binding transcriptional ArsR family regulator